MYKQLSFEKPARAVMFLFKNVMFTLSCVVKKFF